jgi:hypothetical protein
MLEDGKVQPGLLALGVLAGQHVPLPAAPQQVLLARLALLLRPALLAGLLLRLPRPRLLLPLLLLLLLLGLLLLQRQEVGRLGARLGLRSSSSSGRGARAAEAQALGGPAALGRLLPGRPVARGRLLPAVRGAGQRRGAARQVARVVAAVQRHVARVQPAIRQVLQVAARVEVQRAQQARASARRRP